MHFSGDEIKIHDNEERYGDSDDDHNADDKDQ